jgi:release factor glutamine methyltransferase
MKKKIWQIIDLLKTSEQFLFNRGIENPRLNAELLLGATLKMSRVELYMAFERPLNEDELEEYRKQIKQRSLHKPLQYIIGSTEFMGFPFKVNQDVLIPRPETETLVETIIEMKDIIGNEAHFLDIGTGSGCIPISLAKLWSDGYYSALDISHPALLIALENAQINDLNASIVTEIKGNSIQKGDVIFLKHDIMSEINDSIPNDITVMISNPPYINIEEMKSLDKEVRNYEPAISLTDNGDGLSFYKRIFDIAVGDHFKDLRYIFLELSGSQSRQIIELATQYKFNKIDIRKDLSGIDRVLIVRM